MKKYLLVAIGSGLALAFLAVITISAQPITETEPNDTPAQANSLNPNQIMLGIVSPAGDDDYFSIPGVNTSWGFIALADSFSSTLSKDIVLTAYAADGVTELQSSAGSWERGAGIALQNFASGGSDHYLQVSELGGDAQITEYNLRYYQTVVSPQIEIEPNDTRQDATPSSFTMQGAFMTAGDRDCFSFHGQAGKEILLAMDAVEPTLDTVLELVGPDNIVLKSANSSGAGGNEFILYSGLPETGVYAYCVSRVSGTPGPDAIYKAGIVSQGGLYFPPYDFQVKWLNPGPGGSIQIGDTLSFQVAITNTSLIDIPGNVNFGVSYDPACLAYQSANPAPSEIITTIGSVTWPKLPDGLAPGEAYAARLDVIGVGNCKDDMHGWYGLEYYFTSGGGKAPYFVSLPLYLPLVMRGTP